MVWTLLGVFAGGLALNLTPCVYPLIPITVSYFGGRTGQGRGKLAVHGLLYLGGLSVTNSLLGVVAALTGSLMGAALQNPIVLVVVAGVLVLFATSLFGFWELRLPQSLTSAASKSYTGYFGTPVHGVDARCRGSAVFGALRIGIAHLGGEHGQPLARIPHLFHAEHGIGVAAFRACDVFREPGEAPRVRRVDAVGTETDGLGAWWVWRLIFCSPLLPSSVGVVSLAGVVLQQACILVGSTALSNGSRVFRLAEKHCGGRRFGGRLLSDQRFG